MNSDIWVIIPAFNEEKNLAKVLSDLNTKTPNILVINDGSQDRTESICRDLGIKVVSHKINRGQGAALQTGNEAALKLGAKIIVHFDADGQMQVSDIEKMVQPISSGKADIVFGSRFLENTSKIPWTKKYLILKPARILNWIFTGLKLSDAHCGFRALSAAAASQIKIRQDGMAHATEIMEQVRALNLKYCEVPVTIIYNKYGQGFGGGIRIIKNLILSRLLK